MSDTQAPGFEAAPPPGNPLPAELTGRWAITGVSPSVLGGRRPAAAVVGEHIPVRATCFREGHDILGITDINTRFGGGFPLPLAAGGDYPSLILAMAAGEEVTPRLGEYRSGVVMTRFLSEHILMRDGESLVPMLNRDEEAITGGI